jgi:hypothetical protein
MEVEGGDGTSTRWHWWVLWIRLRAMASRYLSDEEVGSG